MKLVVNQRAEKDRVLFLQGSDYEQGFQHGRSAARWIRKNVEDTYAWIAQTYQGDMGPLERYYRDNLAFLESHRPRLLEELHGIADGCGLSFAQIAALNVQLYFTLRWIAPECSQFFRSIRLPDGATVTYTGKTRDNSAGARETVVLMRSYPDGLKMIEVGFAGVVTGPGNVLTSRGISVTSSGVWSPRLPVRPEDFARGEVLADTHRLAMTIASVEEARPYLDSLPRASGMNYIVSSPGKGVLLSLTAREVMSRPANDSLCATNHYPFEAWKALSYQETEYTSTHCRFRRISQLLQNAEQTEDFWNILSDHEHFPQDSVCRHPQDGIGAWTTYGALAMLEEETMYVSFGNPCAIPSSEIKNGLIFEL